MAAVAIKARILGVERWLCFNVAAQMHISDAYGGSIERALEAFAAAFSDGETVGERGRLEVCANWLAALSIGGAAYAKHVGEESRAVTADDFYAECSPYDVGEIAEAITDAVTAGQQRDVENPPENAAKKN